MTGLRKVIAIIIDVLIVLFLIKAPSPIIKGIEAGRVSRWEYKEEAYTGIISVWHVAGFKVHTGAVGNLLKERARQISKNHFGVYISIISMTESEYCERIERGEKADIYSIPLGFEYSDRFLPIDEAEIQNVRHNLMVTGMDEGILYEVPYLYSGYCLVENAQQVKTFANEEVSAESVTAKANNSQKKTILCGNKLCACLYGIQAPVSEENDFRSGNYAYAFSDFREVGDALRRYEQGKGFAVNTYPLTSYTDLVQYIAFDKSIEKSKLPYAKEMLASLLSEGVQESLPSMGAYTTVQFDSAEALRDKYEGIALDLFSMYLQPKIPNSFEFRKCRDTLYADAHDALSGDEAARKRVKSRVDEICNAA